MSAHRACCRKLPRRAHVPLQRGARPQVLHHAIFDLCNCFPVVGCTGPHTPPPTAVVSMVQLLLLLLQIRYQRNPALARVRGGRVPWGWGRWRVRVPCVRECAGGRWWQRGCRRGARHQRWEVRGAASDAQPRGWCSPPVHHHHRPAVDWQQRQRQWPGKRARRPGVTKACLRRRSHTSPRCRWLKHRRNQCWQR